MAEIPNIMATSRLKRSKWSAQEDELLMYTHAILRIRSKKIRFLWTAAKKVLPDRDLNACRNRLMKLRENPKTADTAYRLELLWQRIYSRGIATGELKDDNTFDNVNFDILGHLTYFIQQMQLNPR